MKISNHLRQGKWILSGCLLTLLTIVANEATGQQRPPVKQDSSKIKKKTDTTEVSTADKMPVVKPHHVENMPVVKPQDNSRMPVMRPADTLVKPSPKAKAKN